jgi:hypothetical protein
LKELAETLFADEPGLCLLSFLVEPEETLLFDLTARRKTSTPTAQLTVNHIPVKWADLKEKVECFWVVCSGTNEDFYQAQARELYQLLLAPAHPCYWAPFVLVGDWGP